MRSLYLEESFEGFASHKRVESAVIETECAEYIGQRSEDFSGSRNIFDKKCMKDNISEAVILEKKRRARRYIKVLFIVYVLPSKTRKKEKKYLFTISYLTELSSKQTICFDF